MPIREGRGAAAEGDGPDDGDRGFPAAGPGGDELRAARGDAYCCTVTRSGVRALGRAEYERLLRTGDDYDLFIDGLTREARVRGGPQGAWTAKLTPREWGLLCEYIESARPLRPRRTRVGGRCLSEVAAAKLFERARRKVDVRLGRYEYRAFRLHKDPAGAVGKSYEFAPPDAFTYCLIRPL